MARRNATLSIRFFKIILQTTLQRLKIPNKFTKSYGVSLSNPVLIKPPDGTNWKVYWKKVNGEIWFEKGWKDFTQSYSLQQGYLVLFKYRKGTSNFNVLILGQNAVEIDYDPSCDTDDDENDNVGDSDDESVQILDEKNNSIDHSDDESVEILDERLKRKKNRQRSPLGSTRPHKKVRSETENITKRSSCFNWPKGDKSSGSCCKIQLKQSFFHNSHKALSSGKGTAGKWIPGLKGVTENKEKYVMLQIGKRSWNVKLLRCNDGKKGRRLSAGWRLFASESGLKLGDVCVFELINKKDLVFKVHVF
ncbi:B3 domain-containing transcription factor VRN1-like [Trifolium pratense]|uniref:B3 domain-containing transcription factor VRN1-like n=1 Tax=Trifolium pratense TaxID=57577 RepID=UPI001E6978D8|nr:B3 domain-containing transcription factor VRN1-like [Trifolium pratense]